MKNYILPTIVLTAVFAAYTAGQNTSKEKPVEPCCCKHLQQIAEDIHAIRLNLEEPFIPPEIEPYESLGLPKSPDELKLPKIKPANPTEKLKLPRQKTNLKPE